MLLTFTTSGAGVWFWLLSPVVVPPFVLLLLLALLLLLLLSTGFSAFFKPAAAVCNASVAFVISSADASDAIFLAACNASVNTFQLSAV